MEDMIESESEISKLQKIVTWQLIVPKESHIIFLLSSRD
jgi:hypothetical protein